MSQPIIKSVVPSPLRFSSIPRRYYGWGVFDAGRTLFAGTTLSISNCVMSPQALTVMALGTGCPNNAATFSCLAVSTTGCDTGAALTFTLATPTRYLYLLNGMQFTGQNSKMQVGSVSPAQILSMHHEHVHALKTFTPVPPSPSPSPTVNQLPPHPQFTYNIVPATPSATPTALPTSSPTATPSSTPTGSSSASISTGATPSSTYSSTASLTPPITASATLTATTTSSATMTPTRTPIMNKFQPDSVMVVRVGTNAVAGMAAGVAADKVALPVFIDEVSPWQFGTYTTTPLPTGLCSLATGVKPTAAPYLFMDASGFPSLSADGKVLALHCWRVANGTAITDSSAITKTITVSERACTWESLEVGCTQLFWLGVRPICFV